MKYLGKKSLASVMSRVLKIAFIIGFAGLGVAAFFYIFDFGVLKIVRTRLDFGALQISLPKRTKPSFPWIITEFISGGLLLYIIYRLRVLFVNFADEKVFAEENVKIIRSIGYTLILLGVITPLAELFAGNLIHDYLVQSLSGEGLKVFFNYSVNPNMIIEGLVMLMFGQVFKIATRIAQEHELTI